MSEVRNGSCWAIASARRSRSTAQNMDAYDRPAVNLARVPILHANCSPLLGWVLLEARNLAHRRKFSRVDATLGSEPVVLPARAQAAQNLPGIFDVRPITWREADLRLNRDRTVLRRCAERARRRTAFFRAYGRHDSLNGTPIPNPWLSIDRLDLNNRLSKESEANLGALW